MYSAAYSVILHTMNYYEGIHEIAAMPKTIVTSGSFDGVHRGHQTILRRLNELKKQQPDCQTAVITFEPHPRKVLKPDTRVWLLSTLREKKELLRQQGVDHLLVIPFTKDFSRTTSQEFIQDILIDRLNTRYLIIGYDHRFGHNREGSFAYLKAHQTDYPFTIEEIPRQEIDDLGVSSTKIREALREGRPEEANRYLGYTYTLTGKVVKGQQIGRTIGFPTANLHPEHPDKLVPADGIYAVRVTHQGTTYGGMLSIGVRPTIGEGLQRTIEVNIFDFEKQIYDQDLSLHFVAYLRGEESYDGLETLRQQLARDKVASLRALREAE